MYSPLPWSCCLLESALRCSAVCTSSSNCGFFCSNSRSTFCNSTNTTHLHKGAYKTTTTATTHQVPLSLSTHCTPPEYFSAQTSRVSERAREEMIFPACFLQRAPRCQSFAGVHRTRARATKKATHQILIWLK
jgi:hypothetical protein